DAAGVPPPRRRLDLARTSRRLAPRLAVLAGAHSRAGGAQGSEEEVAKIVCRDAAGGRESLVPSIGGPHNATPNRESRRMAGGPARAAPGGEGPHASQRRVGTAASGAAVGPRRQGVPF